MLTTYVRLVPEASQSYDSFRNKFNSLYSSSKFTLGKVSSYLSRAFLLKREVTTPLPETYIYRTIFAFPFVQSETQKT